MPRATRIDQFKPQYIQVFERPDTQFEIETNSPAQALQVRLELYSMRNQLRELRSLVAARKELRAQLNAQAQHKGVSPVEYYDRTTIIATKRANSRGARLTNPFRPIVWENEERADEWVRLQLQLLQNMEAKGIRVVENKVVLYPQRASVEFTITEVKPSNTPLPSYLGANNVVTPEAIERAEQKPVEDVMQIPVQRVQRRDDKQQEAVDGVLQSLTTKGVTFHSGGARVGPYGTQAQRAAVQSPHTQEATQDATVQCTQCGATRPDTQDKCMKCGSFDILDY